MPFLIIPFLISEVFTDPTLYIKRTSTFILLLIISILLNSYYKKISIKIYKFDLIISILLIYMFIVSFYSSINLNESIWELSFFCGWIALYYLFRAYSTQAVIKSIFLTTAIASFFVCIPSLINYNSNFYNRLEAPFNWEDKAIHKIHFLNPKGDSDIVTVFGESPNHVGLNSINVKKNKIYTFSFWVRALKSKRRINPALSININDNVIEQHFEIDTDWKFVHISKKFSELKPDDSPRAFFCYRDTSSIGFMVWGEKITSGNLSTINSYPNKLIDTATSTLKRITFKLPGSSKIASTF